MKNKKIKRIIFAVFTGAFLLTGSKVGADTFQNEYNFGFASDHGVYPMSSLTQTLDGKYYGMTSNGGINDMGVIFQYDPVADTFTKKHDFDTNDGGTPIGGLKLDSTGKLYGMTSGGGSNNKGVIFKYDQTSDTYTKKHDFDGINGSVPYGSLTLDSTGKFYGMTKNGGANNLGVIFEYDPTSDTYTKKYDFNDTNGGNPEGSLSISSTGKFYGMTRNGGMYFHGVIFEYDQGVNTLIKKYDFGYDNGASPIDSLVLDSVTGKFYGMAYDGGVGNGVIFEYDPTSDTYTKKYNFDGANGSVPYGSLALDSTGKFYGMTATGGVNNRGVIFKYDQTSDAYTKTYDFNVINGSSPFGTLVLDATGKFYGVTKNGAVSGSGSIFEYNPSTNIYTKKFDFGSTDGGNPYNSLALDATGKFYGVTSNGGVNDKGVIFKYDPITKTYTKKFDFDGNNGSVPSGFLTFDSNGKLYGTTRTGGVNGYGVIFEYDPITNVYAKKYDLDGINGNNPYGPLTFYSNGKFYGMTRMGGVNNLGVIFEYDPATNIYTKKFDFSVANGSYPQGYLTADTNGKFYGMTKNGGAGGYGVIFEYDPITNVYAKKYDFGIIDGSNPYDSLTIYSNNKLYGMTANGGVGGYGVIFEYDSATNTYTKKYDFDLDNGGNPQGSLTLSSNGKFYGMARNGGTNVLKIGVIFEYDPATNIYTKKFDFDGIRGSNPYSSLVAGLNDSLYGMTSLGGLNSKGTIFSFIPEYVPFATSVSISGTPDVGNTLTGTYTYNDYNNDTEGLSTYKWYVDDVEIVGEISNTYTIKNSDENKIIKFEVTPIASTGDTIGLSVVSDGQHVNLISKLETKSTHSIGTPLYVIQAFQAEQTRLKQQQSATTTTTTISTGCNLNITRNLKLTKPIMKGSDIKDLQTCLNKMGHNSGLEDGIFGTKTKAGVILFQKNNDLKIIDGIVGPETRGKINN